MIYAVYPGDDTRASATSPVYTEYILARAQPTKTTISATIIGQQVNLTATAKSSALLGNGVPDGDEVTFMFQSSCLCGGWTTSVPVANGAAIITLTPTTGPTIDPGRYSAGYHNILCDSQITYCFAASDATVNVPAAVKTTMTSSLNPSTAGQAVTFTATVTSDYGQIPDAEVVTFILPGPNNGTVKVSVPLVASVASYTTSSLPVTSTTGRTAKAAYLGDVFFHARTGSVMQVVNP